MAWEDPELDTDKTGIIDRILLGMADRLDGWEPVEGAPEVALAEEFGRETAATNALAVEALQLAIAGIGETVFGLQPRVGAAAVLPDVALELARWTPSLPISSDAVTRSVSIASGFTIVADSVAFELLEDYAADVVFTKPAGETYYAATIHVPMTATTEGTIGNVPADTPATIVTSTVTVSSASIVEDGAGGVDEETLADYLDRVSDYLSTLRPGGVRAEDLAALARTVSGVHRAIGFDLLDPDEEDPQERTATIIAIDATGAPVAGSTLTELQATLEAAREVNFNLIVAEPTYTAVDVAVTVVAAAGVDHADLDARVTAALEVLIDPASWGNTAADPTSWTETTALRALDVAVAAAQVAGVSSVTAATVNGSTTSTALAGPGALPAPLDDDTDPSTVAVTVA